MFISLVLLLFNMSRKPGQWHKTGFAGGTIDEMLFNRGARLIYLRNIDPISDKGDLETRFTAQNSRAQEVIDTVDLPERYDLTLKDAIRTFGFMLKNSFQTAPHYIPSFARKMYQAQLSEVNHGDTVILFFHGYHQNAGSAIQLCQDASQLGVKVVAVDYDYRMSPEEFSKTVLLPAQKEVLDRRAGKITVLGHSTGADNSRYSLIHDSNVLDQAVDKGIQYIFSAPLTSGIRGDLSWAQRLVLPFMPQRDKLWTPEGKEQFLALNYPLPEEVKAYTFLCANDMLVRPECGLDTNNNAVNILISDGGHFEGTGISTPINANYVQMALGSILAPK